MNPPITPAAAAKTAALMTLDYVEERAKRGDREAFERALSKVPDEEPVVDGRSHSAAARLTPAL